MNILFVTHAPPDEPHDGARLIVHHLARQLAPRHTLYLCSLLPPGEDESEVRQRLGQFAASALVPLPTRSRPVKWAGQVGARAPLWVRTYDVPALRAALREMLRAQRIDLVHCDTGLMAQYADALAECPRVVAPHDALTGALETQARQALAPVARFAARMQVAAMRRYEREQYARFGRVIVVTERERQLLHSFAPALAVRVIPNGVDLEFYKPCPEVRWTADLGFLGVMDYIPNRAAVLFFTREVLPRIWRALPDATFRIIGKNPTREIRALARDARIQVTGTVADIRPHVAACRVMVCPMQGSGGIKNKLLEGLAMGKAVVATPEAVQGTDARDGVELRMAGTAEDLAVACVQLLREDAARERLERNARAWALGHSWAATAQRYLAVYRELVEAESSGSEHAAAVG